MCETCCKTFVAQEWVGTIAYLEREKGATTGKLHNFR